MGLFDIFRRPPAANAGQEPRASVLGEGFQGVDLSDPALGAYLREGVETHSGAYVGGDMSLRNMAVFRSVDLISSSIGMLPLYVMRSKPDGTLERATDHPLYDLLLSEPNNWQTPFEFKSQMQSNLLIEGDAYALIVRSRGRVLRLIPLDPRSVTWTQNADWSITYRYNRPTGGSVEYSQDEILHLRGMTRDGLTGVARVKMAREAIGLALQAERAAARLFKNGLLAGGVLSHPKTLSDPAVARLKAGLEAKAGAENAHRWLVTEEGMDLKPFPSTAQNSQHLEQQKLQIEEVARAFGVPRPLLMMDDTSWGSGIEQLSILFVTYGLASWFKVWEEGLDRSCLTREERRGRALYCDFDERELLRGSMADQAAYLSKALGAGGSRPWMKQNEARDLVGLSPDKDPDANSLRNPMTQSTASEGSNNDET